MAAVPVDPIAQAATNVLAAGESVEPRLTDFIPHYPHPRQALFLSPVMTLIREVYYGGAAGGGKSDALLMGALQYVDVPGYSAVIVRRTYPMLNQPGGLIERSKEWLTPTAAEWNTGEHRWRFPSGATLTFRHLQNEQALSDYQGAEYDFIGVDEVTDFSLRQYRFLMSRLRSTVDSPVPLRVRSASNPVGPGKAWVKRRFVDPGAVDKGRVFIPARLEDNPSLDAKSYDATLRLLGSVLYAQLRQGDWDIGPEGELFKRAWIEERIISEAALPPDVQRVRRWDLAATEPRGKAARDQGDPDYTVGLLLARDRAGSYYVEDVARGQWSPAKVEQEIGRVAREEDGRGVRITMEQEPGASGKLVIAHFRRSVLDGFNFRGVPSSGSKEDRAQLVAARMEQGDVFFVDGPWLEELIDELAEFPHGLHDDQVDALSGAYADLSETRSGTPVVLDTEEGGTFFPGGE